MEMLRINEERKDNLKKTRNI